MTTKVLFVDDDKNIISAVRRLFIREGHELFFAGSGAEGLKLLKETPVSVIVSDMRMPQMDGVEFLKRAKEICPGAVRLVLSGYSDIKSVLEAVNEGHIWRYITKPWVDIEFKLTIRHAMELHQHTEEKKRLLAMIKAKNEMLEQMNMDYDSKIQDHAWQLQEKTSILNMMAENRRYSEVIEKARDAVSKLLDNAPVFVFAPFLEESFGGIPSEAEQLAREALDGNIICENNKFQAFPLATSGTGLGALVTNMPGSDSWETKYEEITGFSSIISLSLSQQKSLKAVHEQVKPAMHKI